MCVKELEKLAGKTDSPSPEDQDSVCVKELENTSLVCGSDRDLESSVIQHQPQLLSLTCYRNGQSFLVF